MTATIDLLGFTASPFQLKMQALADYSSLTWRKLPEEVSSLRDITRLLKFRWARSRNHIQRYPGRVPGMDEYPAVPFYTLDGQSFFYDSTGLALHLDELGLTPLKLLPEGPAAHFLCRLIDEAFDEFGLYMVHHNRWVTSAHTNIMAEMTVREMRKLLPKPMHSRMKRNLSGRQVRRCPYLFSVAPQGYSCDMPPALTPPAKAGFPETHTLLDTAWRNYLSAMEHVLGAQPFLLGERFTLADASAYGQLSMNLVDGRAAELLRELAPTTFDWLCMIRDGKHRDSKGEIGASDSLNPLIECISETFIPLMQQNHRAFNEEHAMCS